MEEEYKKKYEDAMERMKYIVVVPKNEVALQAMKETIFPELKESEDERIRKIIADAVFCNYGDRQEYLDVLAWLEKQKVNTDGDFARGYDCGYQCCLNSHGTEWLEKQKESLHIPEMCKENADSFTSEQKEQKPAEWSEEDEKMKERLITRLNWITYNTRTDGTSPNITFFDEIDWLKSLRPQPHWKPSEEQMEALDKIIGYTLGDKRFYPQDLPVIESLYNDLKMLM